tara:strand:- start:1972 stop:4320 length:2349 start_codon:yes stop_codon:yes gene_type:complete
MRDIKISVFKTLFESKDVPYNLSLKKVLERIKEGKSKDRVELIRKSKTKDIASANKKKLPCILFGGTFKNRSIKGLDIHSGLSIVDFDGYPSKEIMEQEFKKLTSNPHFIAVFVSPSGNGYKGIIKIPISTAKEHSKYFKAFQKEFEFDYFDISNSNVDRVCFESYDPNIYINWDAELFNPVLIEKGYTVHERVPLLPINDEMVIIDKIMGFDWQKDFNEGERNAFIFDLAGAFCEYGISQTTTNGYIMNNVIHGEFKQSEVSTTIKSAFKTRAANSKYFEDWSKVDRIKIDLKKGKDKVLKIHKISEDVYDEIKEETEAEDFWSIDQKGKVTIIPIKYKFFLERNGFKKHFVNDSEKPTLVKIDSNKVEVTSTAKIKDFVLDYLIEVKATDVWNYCANYQNLFSEQYLLMLESIDLLMLADVRGTSYISFRNGILEVNKDDIKLVDYIDVDGYVWRSQIIDRDWRDVEKDDNDYKQFISNISNKEPIAMECVLGYMLSTYKNRSNNKAIILNDEVISENPEGGTGKGLLIQGLTHIRKTSIIDGKQFDSKKSFAYQTVSLDTKILVFDDVKKNFDFEDKFSLITEGITLERKNKDAVKLNVHESPKIMLSTNYAIKGAGNSHDRRRHEIEIAQHYGVNNSPEDEFSKELFDEWDAEEFNRFDNYMMYCLQTYLRLGLVKQNAKNIVLRKFIAETSMELFEWAEDVDNLPLNIRNDKKGLFEAFTNEYKDFNKWLTRKRFNIWMQKYATYKGFEFTQGSSNGFRWFEINNGVEVEDNNEVPF